MADGDRAGQDHIVIDRRPFAGGFSWNVYAADELVASGWQYTEREARIEAHERGVATALRWLNAAGSTASDV